jgi:hypothetical protein
MLILDTAEFVFRGFTPLQWELIDDRKSDDSMKRFIFKLKNPQNTPERKFALEAERKQLAIYCDSSCGSVFGGGYDIAVSRNCNTRRSTCLHNRDTNDTGLSDEVLFTGSRNFTVRQIKVFEIPG